MGTRITDVLHIDGSLGLVEFGCGGRGGSRSQVKGWQALSSGMPSQLR